MCDNFDNVLASCSGPKKPNSSLPPQLGMASLSAIKRLGRKKREQREQKAKAEEDKRRRREEGARRRDAKVDTNLSRSQKDNPRQLTCLN